MGITLASNFDVNAALPLDSRMVVADLTARDAIDAGRRYAGMTVYVVADTITYQLKGGILNADWTEYGSGASASAYVETFSGDGVTLTFTLATDPLAIENTQVYVDGVYQQKTASYNLNTPDIEFVDAPPTGTDNIEVVYMTPASPLVIPDGYIDDAKIVSMDAAKLTGTIPPSTLNYQISSSSGTFVHTGNIAITDVTNLSVTITTTGRPVFVGLISDGSSNYSYLSVVDNQITINFEGYFYRDATNISLQVLDQRLASASIQGSGTPVSTFNYIDVPAAGTYTYKFAIRNSYTSQTCYVYRAKLITYEL